MAEARSLDEILKSGVIRVGVNPNLAPMARYNEANQIVGFDVDVANRIGEALKVKVELVAVVSQQRVPLIVADRIDICLGALARTSERTKLIDYTVPLHTEAMAVLTTDKVKFTNWREFNVETITLANTRGNSTVEFLQQTFPKAKMLLVEATQDVVRSVAQGRADAVIENIDFFMAFTKNYPDVKWKVLPETIRVAYDGIGLQKGNNELRTYLNTLLYEMHTSDFVNATWEKWYGSPPTAKVTPIPYF